MKKIVIIPSYNEEKNIGKVIRGIRKNHRNLDVLVINDIDVKLAYLSDSQNRLALRGLLETIDVLIDGRYIDELRDLTLPLPFLGIITIDIGSTPAPAPAASLP